MWTRKLDEGRDEPTLLEVMEDYPEEGRDYLLSLIVEIHEVPDVFHMIDSLTEDLIDLEPKQFLTKRQIHLIKDVLEQVEAVTVNQLRKLLCK